MPRLSAETKHHILLEYQEHCRERSFAALAARHGIKGGRKVVARWYRRWDGTARSLQELPRSGRPPLFSTAQVRALVQRPISAANRAHRAVHYTDLMPRVRAATDNGVSLRTVQRYGKEVCGAKQKHTKKRTADESTCARGAGLQRVCALR